MHKQRTLSWNQIQGATFNTFFSNLVKLFVVCAKTPLKLNASHRLMQEDRQGFLPCSTERRKGEKLGGEKDFFVVAVVSLGDGLFNKDGDLRMKCSN